MAPPLPRVVVTGTESTGKTTLARDLAAAFGTVWVPEQSRRWAEAKGAPLGPEDVEPIARATMEAEAEAAPAAQGLLVLDTDLASTVVYARHYYGACPAWIEREARARRPALYLLCHPDVPWVDDPIRDRPHFREQLHALFHHQLVRSGAPIVHVTGSWAARRDLAVDAVRALVAGG